MDVHGKRATVSALAFLTFLAFFGFIGLFFMAVLTFFFIFSGNCDSSYSAVFTVFIRTIGIV